MAGVRPHCRMLRSARRCQNGPLQSLVQFPADDRCQPGAHPQRTPVILQPVDYER